MVLGFGTRPGDSQEYRLYFDGGATWAGGIGTKRLARGTILLPPEQLHRHLRWSDPELTMREARPKEALASPCINAHPLRPRAWGGKNEVLDNISSSTSKLVHSKFDFSSTVSNHQVGPGFCLDQDHTRVSAQL